MNETKRVSLILEQNLYDELVNASKIADRSLNYTAAALLQAALKEKERNRKKNAKKDNS